MMIQGHLLEVAEVKAVQTTGHDDDVDLAMASASDRVDQLQENWTLMILSVMCLKHLYNRFERILGQAHHSCS